MSNLICPICGNALKAMGTNPNLYTCTKRKVWVSDLGIHVEIVDAAISLSSTGKQIYKVIEVPPYIFSIADDEGKKQTEITEMVPIADVPWRKIVGRPYDRKVILRISAALDLPWHDKQKVFEKVRLYLLFS